MSWTQRQIEKACKKADWFEGDYAMTSWCGEVLFGNIVSPHWGASDADGATLSFWFEPADGRPAFARHAFELEVAPPSTMTRTDVEAWLSE